MNVGDSILYYTLPGSNTGGILNLTQSSNVGLNGRWMYRVDGKNIVLPNKAPLPGLLKF
jgi:hypothetical protein